MNRQISTSTKPNADGKGFNRKTTIAIFTVVLCFLFSGCASFSDQMINHHKIDLLQKNLSELSGTYQLKPDWEYNKEGEAKMAQGEYLIENVHRYISGRRINFDTLTGLLLTVKVLDSSNITFLFKKDEAVLDSVTLSVELGPAGLLYLGNHYVETTGIPYLCGSTMSEKTRIGLANDGGLILNHIFNSSGGFLLIFSGSYSSQSAYHLKRIK
ncbi:hypothetical protein G7074_13810 [Pedobacter sp. HDW13]|uniref:hypothetical protein n=1 Tax=unclassified Pedobacter TaxID=2628915 RepID=UPI000F5A6DD0|nr:MULTISPECIES: hypothetical protein [unclassified Pedobacter]QIL40240.1 hypothetical protein G7074_13810 [Pedobacter sp. HDW13]